MNLYDTFHSPLGTILVATDGQNLTGVYFLKQKYFETIPTNWHQNKNNPILKNAIQQIKEYFLKIRKNFDLPLTAQGTPFQKKVWSAVERVPYGKTVTYQSIAQNIGNPNAVRAVGTAIGKNPLCLVVPCHRVVGMQGNLTGYAGGMKRKQQLLNLEGHLF